LGRGRPCFPPDFACPAVLTFMTHPRCWPVTYGTLTLSGALFQCASAGPQPPGEHPAVRSRHHVQPPTSSGSSLVRWVGLGSSRFARRYYGNPLFSSGYVRCFSSPGSLSASAESPVSRWGCPIRSPQDHRVPAPPLRISPRGRVLHRPLTPRHPPSALLRLCLPTSSVILLRGARGDVQNRHPRSQRRSRHLHCSRCSQGPPATTRWSRGDSNPGPPPCKGGALPD
jgi:hypothetical protein